MPMKEPEVCIIAVNGGSSTIKFAVYQINDVLERTLSGQIEGIGVGDTNLTFNHVDGKRGSVPFPVSDHGSAASYLVDWLYNHVDQSSIIAVGHRVVHGMNHTEPQLINEGLLKELHKLEVYDPDHLPGEIELIKEFNKRDPKLLQVACFDTSFHRTMPRVAKLLPIPRRYEAKGVQRYGFHGLSYAYLMQELERLEGQKAARGRVILAHLGSGASIAAVKDGLSVDTTMGFTPASGLVMSTRSGDLDPGVVSFLANAEKMSASQFDNMINHESGMLGVSETSADMRELLAREADDVRAAEAVDLFCYQAKKWIGAYTAVLGGLDTLVFSGGIGENAPRIRERICAGLEFLGIELNGALNAASAGVISSPGSPVIVRVIRTDEELMIARSTRRVLGLHGEKEGT